MMAAADERAVWEKSDLRALVCPFSLFSLRASPASNARGASPRSQRRRRGLRARKGKSYRKQTKRMKMQRGRKLLFSSSSDYRSLIEKE